MKVKLLLPCLLAITVGILPLKAQNNDFARNDVRLSYGIGNVYQMALTSLTVTSTIFIVPFDSAYKSTVKDYGTFSFQYQYRVSKLIQVGAAVSFNPGSIDVKYDKGSTSYSTTYFVSVMPRIDFTYVNRGLITMYSGLALGATYYSIRNNYSNQPDNVNSGLLFGFQVNGIGIRVGKNIGGFAEFGFGCLGIVNLGFSAKL